MNYIVILLLLIGIFFYLNRSSEPTQKEIQTLEEDIESLNQPIKIKSREFGLKNLLRKIYRRKPKN